MRETEPLLHEAVYDLVLKDRQSMQSEFDQAYKEEMSLVIGDVGLVHSTLIITTLEVHQAIVDFMVWHC